MLLRAAPYYGLNPSGVTYYTGASAVSSLVPDTFHVSLGGHNYMVDLNQPFYRQYRRQLAQLIRTQADTSKDPGEQSMDPNSLWRRSFEDPSLGAGQRYLDRQDSVPNRFFSSKGIDALTTRWQFSLLPDTRQLKASVNTNIQTVVVGTHVYVIDGQTLAFAPSLGGSFTTVTGTPASTASSIATDGFNVWVCYGTNGVYTTTEGAGTATQYVTSPVNVNAVIGYCNGRLMLASTNIIYNITASGALPTPLFTSGNPNMTFSGFAEGDGAIYAGASAGSRSWIYGMTVTSDGTALGAPVIQGALPAGETVSSVFGYLGFLIVGTSLGIRMCTTATSGAVTLGALITGIASAGGLYGPLLPVQGMAGSGRFVYFSWTNYDTASTGLGRLDLQNQVISTILPAFCSDLMVTGQGNVTSVAVYNGSPIFTVVGLGLYGPSVTQLVASGTITSGYILYDLVDTKVACLLDIEALGPVQHGTYSPLVAVDSGTPMGVGTVVPSDPVLTHTFGVGPHSGQRFEVSVTLLRDSTTLTLGPVITRWTLRSYPAPKRPRTWQLPLMLNESIINRSGSSGGFDPLAELSYLEGLASSGNMVTYQESNLAYPVFVQDVEFLPDYTMENRTDSYFNGIALVTLVGLPITGAL